MEAGGVARKKKEEKKKRLVMGSIRVVQVAMKECKIPNLYMLVFLLSMWLIRIQRTLFFFFIILLVYLHLVAPQH